MTAASVIFDVSVLLVLVFCTIYYARKGFVAGILGLVGTIAAIVAAWFIAQSLSAVVFESLIRPGLEQRITEALAQHTDLTAQSLEAALNDMAAYLPEYAVDAVVNAFEYNAAADPAAFAANMVTDMIQPTVLPIIVLVLFIIAFLLLRIVLGVIIFVVGRIAKLPVLGTANSALGAAMGVFVAGVYVFLAVVLLRAASGALAGLWQGANPFTGSIFYRLFSGIEPLNALLGA